MYSHLPIIIPCEPFLRNKCRQKFIQRVTHNKYIYKLTEKRISLYIYSNVLIEVVTTAFYQKKKKFRSKTFRKFLRCHKYSTRFGFPKPEVNKMYVNI